MRRLTAGFLLISILLCTSMSPFVQAETAKPLGHVLKMEEDIKVSSSGLMSDRVYLKMRITDSLYRDRFGDFPIPFDADSQKVILNSGRTITPDGKVVYVTQEHVHTNDAEPGSYDNYKIRTITLPGLTEGAQFELDFTVQQTRSYMPGAFWNTFSVGLLEGCQIDSMIFSVEFPKGTPFRYHARNIAVKPVIHNQLTKDPSSKKSISYTQYRWALSNINMPVNESWGEPGTDASPELAVSSISSWSTVRNWAQRLFDARLNPADPAVKARALSIVGSSNARTDEEKVRALYNFVTTEIRYVAIEYGLSGYQPRLPAKVLTNRYGDCKDKATLLVAMLRSLGYTAYPLLIAAADLYVDPIIPSPGFNHAIAVLELNGQRWFLDGTASYTPADFLPTMDQAKSILVLKPGNGKLESAPVGLPEFNGSTAEAKGKLDAQGSVDLDASVTFTGENAGSLRYAISYSSVQDNVLQSVLSAYVGEGKTRSMSIDNLRANDPPCTVKGKVLIQGVGRKVGRGMAVEFPGKIGDALGSRAESEDRERTSSMRLPPQTFVTAITLTPAPGYALDSVPDSVHLSLKLPDGTVYLRFDQDWTNSAQGLKMTRKLVMWDVLLPADQAKRILDFSNQVAAAEGQLVLYLPQAAAK